MKKVAIIVAALSFTGILAGFIVTRKHAPEIRHIVLISMDTTRADYLSCYGYPEVTTPNIDAVAQHATRFETVVSPVPITLPAHSSMLTGMIPPAHGVHHNFNYQLADSHETIAETLKREDFKTAGIISTYVLHSQFGISQGFDLYDDSFTESHRSEHGVERGGLETTQLALNWLDANKDEKSFLFLHYYDPHYTYESPEPFASNFPDSPYAGEIAFTDHCIGKVIQKLKDLDLYDSTLLIIMGDHGEMLGEHGERTHTYFIYESAIKVPLIIKRPGQKKAFTIAEPVGLVDIVPTICSQLDIALPSRVQGVDLSTFLQGEVQDNYERHLYSESVAPTRFGASSLMAISHGQWKYIQAPRAELYDVVADPGENNNLLKQERQRARIYEDKLRETLELSVGKDPDSQMVLDAESIKRLESLGYVAGKEDGEIVFDEDKGDPKDFVHLIELMRDVKFLTKDKKYNQAKAILNNLAPQCPDTAEIFIKLGEIGMLQPDYECAVVNYRRVYQLDPASIPPGTYNNLAWIQATQPLLPGRDVAEAIVYAKKFTEMTKFKDPHALDTLSVAYAASGDFPKAVETAQKARALAVSSNNTELVQKITKRLKLFEQSKPYFEYN